ncbi:MAG: hypothetical protein Hens3KO_20770 [Henriciella sp.]
MAKIKLKLPKLGMSLDEAKIVEWHVANGDKVSPGATIYSVETDKSTLEIECPFEGEITIIGEVGQSFRIGDIVAEINT